MTNKIKVLVYQRHTQRERKREVIIYPCITEYNKETIHYMYYMTFNNAFCRYILKQLEPEGKKGFFNQSSQKMNFPVESLSHARLAIHTNRNAGTTRMNTNKPKSLISYLYNLLMSALTAVMYTCILR